MRRSSVICLGIVVLYLVVLSGLHRKPLPLPEKPPTIPPTPIEEISLNKQKPVLIWTCKDGMKLTLEQVNDDVRDFFRLYLEEPDCDLRHLELGKDPYPPARAARALYRDFEIQPEAPLPYPDSTQFPTEYPINAPVVFYDSVYSDVYKERLWSLDKEKRYFHVGTFLYRRDHNEYAFLQEDKIGVMVWKGEDALRAFAMLYQNEVDRDTIRWQKWAKLYQEVTKAKIAALDEFMTWDRPHAKYRGYQQRKDD